MGYYHLGQPAREGYERSMPWFTAVRLGPVPGPTPPAVAVARGLVTRGRLLPDFLSFTVRAGRVGLGGLMQVVKGFLSGGGKILSLAGKVAMMVPGGQLIGAGMMIGGAGMELGGAVLTVADSVAEKNKLKAAQQAGQTIPPDRPFQSELTTLTADFPEAPPPAGSPLSPIGYTAPPVTTGTVAPTEPIPLGSADAAKMTGFCIPASPPGNPGYINFIQSEAELESYTAQGWSIPSPWGNAGFKSPCVQPGGMVNAGVGPDGSTYVYDQAAKSWQPYVPSTDTAVQPYDGQVGYDPTSGQWQGWLGGRWSPVGAGTVGVDPSGSLFALGGGGGGSFLPNGSVLQADGGAYYQHPEGPLGGGPGLYQLDPGTVGQNNGTPAMWNGSGFAPLPTGMLASDSQLRTWRWNGTAWEPATSLSPGTTATGSAGGQYVWDGSKWVSPDAYAAMVAAGAAPAMPAAPGAAPGETLALAAGAGNIGQMLAGIPTWAWLAAAGLVVFSMSQDTGGKKRKR